MTKKTVWRIVALLLTALWMFFIYRMSAADAEESTDMSMSVGYTVGMLVVDEFETLPPDTQDAYVARIDHPVRKTAHFMEYTILGILISLDILLFTGLSPVIRLLLSWVLGVAYAFTDEFHQLFVSGRSGQITDVLIDGSGVLLGCLLVLGVTKLWHFGMRNENREGNLPISD